MFALSNREMGQPAFAALAISRILALSEPGTFAVTSRLPGNGATEPLQTVTQNSNDTPAKIWLGDGSM